MPPKSNKRGRSKPVDDDDDDQGQLTAEQLAEAMLSLKKTIEGLVRRETKKLFVDPEITAFPTFMSNEHIVLALIVGACKALQGDAPFSISLNRVVPKWADPVAMLTHLGCAPNPKTPEGRVLLGGSLPAVKRITEAQPIDEEEGSERMDHDELPVADFPRFKNNK